MERLPLFLSLLITTAIAIAALILENDGSRISIEEAMYSAIRNGKNLVYLL